MKSLTDEEISEFIAHDVEPYTIFVLLTNCQGTWPDTGLGGVLKRSYPAAYGRYKGHCAEKNGPDGHPTEALAGSCHIIPPISVDHVNRPVPPAYIACIFSSFGDGHRNWFNTDKPGRSSKALIRLQTADGFGELKKLLREMGLNRAQETSCSDEIESTSESPQKPNWTENGLNMKVCLYEQNGKDFQMQWKEVDGISQGGVFSDALSYRLPARL
ncbi:uncharacterized protein GGS22DRAFT_186218 [Annulohypoxylon maeteangense]|uniref:uncharacterized protein n=1 Tax=Annulohypoxylon maeteangense TaxID=1927788 RepID=UPI002008A941|nr:uncharacterized protein GGS22DRAFT_186218 [Annulohypoxylon maeteangense]KAI0887389.1 hypothetical protein GGS22DRAFT_186218 [Annulohypoxylon maeteangense]